MGQTESPPHAQVRAFSFSTILKTFIAAQQGLPHALLLMKKSPTDAHEEKPFWPFGAMKREPGWFGNAQVRAFGTIPGPLPYPHEILLQGFGHRVRVRALTQTTIWGVREFNRIAKRLVRAFMSTTWGVRAFTITAKQALVGL